MQIKNQLEPLTEKIQFYFQRMSDIRFAGQLVFVVIVLLISWSGVKSIQTNYNLQKQITELKQQNSVQKLQNDNQSLGNQYLKSNQYLELSARENLGLAMAGETEVIVPASVAKEYETSLPNLTSASNIKTTQSKTERNVQSWVDFFLHRHAVSN
jgi:cell division protein FtsB